MDCPPGQKKWLLTGGGCCREVAINGRHVVVEGLKAMSTHLLGHCPLSNNFITAYPWNEWQIGKPGFSLVINSLMKILHVI